MQPGGCGSRPASQSQAGIREDGTCDHPQQRQEGWSCPPCLRWERGQELTDTLREDQEGFELLSSISRAGRLPLCPSGVCTADGCSTAWLATGLLPYKVIKIKTKQNNPKQLRGPRNKLLTLWRRNAPGWPWGIPAARGSPLTQGRLLAWAGGQEGGQPAGWAAPVAAQARGCSGNKEPSLPECFSTIRKLVWLGWEAVANTGSLSGGARVHVCAQASPGTRFGN